MDNKELLDAIRGIIKEEVSKTVKEEVSKTVREEVSKTVKEEVSRTVREEVSKAVKEEISQAETRIMKGAAVLMDAEFTKHFKLLSEQQTAALAHAATDDDLDIIDGEIEDLKSVVHVHTEEIAALKMAN